MPKRTSARARACARIDRHLDHSGCSMGSALPTCPSAVLTRIETADDFLRSPGHENPKMAMTFLSFCRLALIATMMTGSPPPHLPSLRPSLAPSLAPLPAAAVTVLLLPEEYVSEFLVLPMFFGAMFAQLRMLTVCFRADGSDNVLQCSCPSLLPSVRVQIWLLELA